MKIRNIAAGIALTAAVAAIGGIYADLHKELKHVPVAVTDVRGDRSALDGVSLTFRTGLSNRGVWTTEYDPAAGAGRTTFSPSGEEDRTGWWYQDRSMSVDTAGGITVGDMVRPEDLTGLSEDGYWMGACPVRMLMDFAEHAGDSDNYTETFRLTDYCDVCPVNLSLEWCYDQPSGYPMEGYGREELDYYWYSENDRIARVLGDLITVPAEDSMTVTIRRYEDMDGILTEITTQGNDTSGEYYTRPVGDRMLFVRQSRYAESGAAAPCVPADHKLMALDMEKFRALYITTTREEVYPDLYENEEYIAGQLKEAMSELTVFPEDLELTGLEVSDDESQIFVNGILDRHYVMLVIDAGTGDILQTLDLGAIFAEISAEEDAEMVDTYAFTDRVMQEDAQILFSSEHRDMIALRKKEDGTWYVWLMSDPDNSIHLPGYLYEEEPESSAEALRTSDEIALYAPWPRTCQFRFMDDRLIAVGWTRNSGYNPEGGYYEADRSMEEAVSRDDNTLAHGIAEICVFTRDGLQYQGLAELQGCGRIYIGNPDTAHSIEIGGSRDRS